MDALTDFANALGEKPPSTVKEIGKAMQEMNTKLVDVLSAIKTDVNTTDSLYNAIKAELISIRASGTTENDEASSSSWGRTINEQAEENWKPKLSPGGALELQFPRGARNYGTARRHRVWLALVSLLPHMVLSRKRGKMLEAPERPPCRQRVRQFAEWFVA
ncbi:hypothetical protein MRX96_048898 [Rhipicephalus microplus]